MSQALQQSVSMQQAQVQTAQSSAAYNFAMGNGTSRSWNDFEQFVNSLDKSQQQQFAETQQAVKGHTERVAKSYGYEGEEVAQVQRALSAQVHAGAKFDTSEWMPGWIAEKFSSMSSSAGVQATGNAGVTTGESERAKRAAQEIVEAVYNDQQVSAYMQSRSQTLSEAERLGHGQECAQSASRQEGFQSSMQRVESASQSLTAAQTRMAEQQASFSATAGRSINTGNLLAVSSRRDLELMAMNPGMNRLHGALQGGVNNIDALRIAANADLSSQLRKTEGGDQTALRSAMHSLDVLSQSNQYNAHDATSTKQILEQRSGMYAAASGGGRLPTHGEASNDARIYREAYGSGVAAGAQRLEDSTDTRREPQPSGGNMRGTFYGERVSGETREAPPAMVEHQTSPSDSGQSVPSSSEVSTSYTQGKALSSTRESATVFDAEGEVREPLNTGHGSRYSGQPATPLPAETHSPSGTPPTSTSPDSQWENLPKPFMKAATANRANLEAEAAASREALREQAGTAHSELMREGKQVANDVSALDATSGTVVNASRVLNSAIMGHIGPIEEKTGVKVLQKGK